MAATSVQLIPSQEEIMQILKRNGAFREGHFVYPNGKHTAHYFQMPLAFGVRDALSAQQIYWAEQENGQRMFRQYVNQGDIAPCIIVDDIIRSGHAIEETVELVKSLGAPIIGCGAIVRFTSAPDQIEGVPIKSLVEFDEKFYDSAEQCDECTKGVPEEHVRF